MTAPAYPSEFVAAVERLLADEGGYSANPSDPGGETRWGISKREYPDLDIKNLTREGAIEIYFRDWWSKYGFGLLPTAIGAKVFNLAVNIGPTHAVKCLQNALRACGYSVAADGVPGQLTIASAKQAEIIAADRWTAPLPTPLLAALRSEAAGYYRAIAALERGRRKNGDGEFLNGWLNRAYE